MHKAKLRSFSRAQLAPVSRALRRAPTAEHAVAAGEGAWEVANRLGMSLRELRTLNKGERWAVFRYDTQLVMHGNGPGVARGRWPSRWGMSGRVPRVSYRDAWKKLVQLWSRSQRCLPSVPQVALNHFPSDCFS